MNITGYDLLGIGACLFDNIIKINDSYIDSIDGEKGGMVLLDDYGKFLEIIGSAGEILSKNPSGSTVNVIRTAASLGTRCRFIGKIGDDNQGNEFETSLQRIGICTSLSRSAIPTAQTICLISSDGERTLRTFIGASGTILEEDIDVESFKHVRHVHMEGYMTCYHNLLERIVEIAKENQATVSIDLGSFEIVETFKSRFLNLIKSGQINILFGNQVEMKKLTEKDPENSCKLLMPFCETVIVTMGGEGCIASHNNHILAYPAAFAESIIDTTGAGDSFIGGFLHAYLNDKPFEECVKIGAILGSATVQVLGTHLNEETLNKVKNLISNNQALSYSLETDLKAS